jgi:hypothetical protein
MKVIIKHFNISVVVTDSSNAVAIIERMCITATVVISSFEGRFEPRHLTTS